MPHLLYYIPGHKAASISKEQLERVGLASQFDRFRPASRLCSRGPDEGRRPNCGGGLVVADDAITPEAHMMAPDRQHWEPAGPPESAPWWVGRWKEGPFAAITPADLARKEQVDGHLVELADGFQPGWLIPVARSFLAGRVRIPGVLALGPDGKLVRRELPRFAAVSAAAERAARSIVEVDGAQDPPLLMDEAWSIACEALAVNYRVTPREISFLGLLTDANIIEVLRALIDWPTMVAAIAAQKKRSDASTPATSATSPGGAGLPPSTSPPSPTSGSSSSPPESPPELPTGSPTDARQPTGATP
jgi:hypothetical protein